MITWDIHLPPDSVSHLMDRCRALEGLTLGQLASRLAIHIPQDVRRAKGWIGAMLEKALCVEAGCQARPDFSRLGIELKTLPIGKDCKPVESTFVTTLSLSKCADETWLTSACYLKLACVLWMPIEGDVTIPWYYRRLGLGFLWSPSETELSVLECDWTLLTTRALMGRMDTIDATLGTYLQLRPKAAHAGVLCDAYDDEGTSARTLPRGFYLRRQWTASIWQNRDVENKHRI